MKRIVWIACVVLGCLSRNAAFGQVTERVSVSSTGAQANGTSWFPVMTPDGRYVVFSSDATNLVPGDGNACDDIFVRDRLNGTTERVSVDSSGTEANGYSWGPAISPDGRFVAFVSVATNLVPGDTNRYDDIFVRDRWTGTTERVSVDSAGAQGMWGGYDPSISADGRFVAFDSFSDQLVPGDTNVHVDVFVHDRQMGTTERVSVASNGAEGDEDSRLPSISADGRFVAFRSGARTLVPGDTNETDDIFVHDRLTGATERVSVSSTGAQANGVNWGGQISADGKWVVINSSATNLVPGGVGGILVRDRQNGITTRASVSSSGAIANQGCDSPSISSDGRYVAFASRATNLAWPPGTGNSPDVFLHDRRTGTTVCATLFPDGTAWGGSDSTFTSVSDDGRYVAFNNIWSLDPPDTNDAYDVFVRDFQPAAVSAFCFGDGTGPVCPCANLGSGFRGCENSAGTGGAVLLASGFASLSSDTLRISSHGERLRALSLLVQGDASISAKNFGDGLSCVGGVMKRLYAANASLGIVTVPRSADPSVSARSAALGDPIGAGTARFYQVYYRDPAPGFCPGPQGGTFNVSNAISAVWSL